MEKIDFVIPWVDGGDPEWQKEKEYWRQIAAGIDNPEVSSFDASVNRYRDWENLRYWFRGVEKYAPWVNQIHFVTCGQVPEWLNPDAPKLHLVNHMDYIPTEYLPTFSSHPIELNFHRIEGLEEKFVYFCDDFFLISPVEPTDFFVKGKPCDSLEESFLPFMEREVYNNVYINDLVFANQHFPRMENRRAHRDKWFSVKTPLATLHNLAMSTYRLPGYAGLNIHHLPQAYLKATLQAVWELEPGLLQTACSHKFRHQEDVSQCVFKFYQMLSGNFEPYNKRKFGVNYTIGLSLDEICDAITHHRYKAVGLNDQKITDFEYAKNRIIHSFEEIFPDKSSFEK